MNFTHVFFGDAKWELSTLEEEISQREQNGRMLMAISRADHPHIKQTVLTMTEASPPLGRVELVAFDGDNMPPSPLGAATPVCVGACWLEGLRMFVAAFR